MKRTGALILLCCLILAILCGCKAKGENNTSLDYVKLCDYKTLEISEDEYSVSDADISTAVRMQLESLGLDSAELTDAIASEHFGLESAEEVKLNMKREIACNRFFEASLEKIFSSCEIKDYPDSSEAYVENLMKLQRKYAQNVNISLEEYLDKAYGLTEEEFSQQALLSFSELMIMEAIAKKENYEIDSVDRSELIKETALAMGISEEEAGESFGKEYFDSVLYEEFLKNLILEIYGDTIDKAIV